MQALDIKTFPLIGQSLIEASAGTGKTFTISALYNRLILGHQHQRLGCDEILVVTFTKAATEELRGRLRARVSDTFNQVLRLQNDAIDSNSKDSDLEQFKGYLSFMAAEQQLSEEELLEQLNPWLKANLALMDEASIFTIHGFCQRVLQRFAFDTGVMFSAEMTLDSQQYLQQACEDVWRQVAYGLNREQSQALLAKYSGPNDLLSAVRSRFNQQGVQVRPFYGVHSFDEAWQKFAEAFRQAQHCVATTSEQEINDLLLAGDLDGRSFQKGRVPGWTASNFAYLKGNVNINTPASLERFEPRFMLEKSKSGNRPEHALFTAVETLLASREYVQFFLNLAWFEQIKTRFFELLNRASMLTPNDLLRLLHQALNSSQGQALAEQIRTLYPFAMIDEFQDTDSLQYEIFNQIYPLNQGSNSHGLIMIGDPKQAIYAFRGADIFTYIKAKQALGDQALFTLDTNYRSHSKLVAGVNALFERNPEAFVYHQDIPFLPVKSGGLHDGAAFMVEKQEQPPLQIVFDATEYNAEQARKEAAKQCAAQIAQLLNGTATLGAKPVAASDIVVLVRSRKQAGWIRNALRQESISSVFLTQDSVYKTPDALDLFRWLHAVAHPSDERALRTALASGIQSQSAKALADFLVDEEQWEAALLKQQEYHQLWRTRGVMAAIMRWLESDDLAMRLRQQHDGERRLTNLIHLGDLLQSASRKLQGHEALLRWFAEHVFAEDSTGEEAQLRLESDADLVSIVTIHRSKGLQYPLVFLPFVWDDKNEPHSNSDTLYYDDASQNMVLHLAPEKEHKELALKAATAENMRLLYVALTRAEQGCFVWLMNSHSRNKSNANQSALGTLLKLDNEPDWSQLAQDLASTPIYFGALPNWLIQARQTELELPDTIQAAQIAPRSFDDWRVSSYSQLVAQELEAQPEQALIIKDDEGSVGLAPPKDWLNIAEPVALRVEFDLTNLALTFVKGAQAGNALHDVLEHWDFKNNEQLAMLCESKLQYYGLPYEPQQLPELMEWMRAIVTTPLNNAFGETLSLASLTTGGRLSEMEFHLPVQQRLQPHQLETLLGSSQRFTFNPLTGYLKGFIDLVFEHNGRYYVADYKSNFLGETASDYMEKSLEQAMFDHAYDLQAWIYTLALDALLRLRLPNYSPEQHLGGVYYLFLRGMHLGEHSPQVTAAGKVEQSLGVYYQAPDYAHLQQWRAAFFNGGASA